MTSPVHQSSPRISRIYTDTISVIRAHPCNPWLKNSGSFADQLFPEAHA
jgi:hypothetical protein